MQARPAKKQYIANGVSVRVSKYRIRNFTARYAVAAEQSEALYPKRFVPASMGINLTGTIRPGEYTIAVVVKDAVGNQSYETKFTFTVE